MESRMRYALVFCTLSFGPAFAQAQTPQSSDVVITAHRLGAGATAAATVLDEAAIDRRAGSFALDAIATVPGVSVNQTGAFGGLAGVRIRGASSEQTLVLIDGAPVNDPSAPGGGFNAAFLDTADIARIEVLRGPQSTLWGADAIGGIISIETRRPADGAQTKAFAEAGSFGAARAGGSWAYGAPAFDVLLSAVAAGADGVSKAEARDGNPEADDYDSHTLSIRGGFSPLGPLRLEAFARRSDSRTEFDGFGLATGVADSDDREETEETLAGGAARLASADGRARGVLSYSRTEIDRAFFANNAESFAASGARETARLQIDLAPASWARLAAGAERETAQADGFGGTRTIAAFALGEITTDQGLILSAGLRQDDHDRFGEVLSTRLGAAFRPDGPIGLRASWGEGFKAPTAFQLGFFFPPAAAANIDLAPERAQGWDAAVTARTWGGLLTAELGWFHLETDDLIVFRGGRYENQARAQSEGLEASAQVTAAPGLSFAAAYSFIDAINPETGAAQAQIPRHAGFLEAQWAPRRWIDAAVQARFNGEEPDLNFGAFPAADVENAAWTRIDASLRLRPAAGLEVYARADNIADEAYQDVFGYGVAGRSFTVGLRADFR